MVGHLKMMWVGQTIDFQAEYSDEIPTLQAQTLALNYLYDHPLMVQGLVDVENGLIYRTSPNPLRRAASILGNSVAVILAGYSIDSVIDLVLLRFGDVSSTRIDALKKQLAQSAQIKTEADH